MWQADFERILVLVGAPLIIALGWMGNGIALAVMLRRIFRGRSSATYVAILMLVDSINLLALLKTWFTRGLHAELGIDCRILSFLLSWLSHADTWVITAIHLDRCLVSLRPQSFKAAAVKRPIMATTTALTVLGLFSMHFFYGKEKAFDNQCLTKHGFEPWYEHIQPMADIIVYVGLPSVAVIASNVLVSMRRKQLPPPKDPTERKMTVMLMSISSTILLLTAPYILFMAISKRSGIEVVPEALHSVLLILLYLKSALAFFIFTVTSALFRQELSSMMHDTIMLCVKKEKPSAELVFSTEETLYDDT